MQFNNSDGFVSRRSTDPNRLLSRPKKLCTASLDSSYALTVQSPSTVADHLKHFLEELSGSNLRLSANIMAPYFSIRIGPDGTFTYEGYHFEVVKFIAQALNITYTFIYQNMTEANIVGLMDSATNMLLRNEIDLNVFGYPLSEIYCSKMDCAFPLFQYHVAMMVPWPETESPVLAPIKPFQLPVWICLFMTCILMLFPLVLIPRIYLKFVNGKQNNEQPSEPINLMDRKAFGNAAVYILTILMSQGNWAEFKQLSFRIMIAAFCLIALVLDNAYSGTLISFLTAPKLMPVTRSLDDLATQRYQKVLTLTEKNEEIANFFLSATSGPEKVIGDSFRNHPENMFTIPDQGIDLLCTGKFAYLAADVRLYPFLYAANKKAGRCLLTVSNKDIPEILGLTHAAYTFKKNWRYTDAVNSKIQIWRDSGLADFWLKMILPVMEGCLLENYKHAQEKPRTLSLSDFSGSFSILLLGCSLALLVFLMEHIIHFARRKSVIII